MVVRRGAKAPRFFLPQTVAGEEVVLLDGGMQCVKTLQNLDGGSGGGRGGHARGDVACDRVDAFRARSVFAEGCDGFAGVAADAYLRVNLDLAEEWDAESLRHALAFAVAEHVNVPLAMRAIKIAHVFDDAEDFDVYLAKHF